MARRRRPADRRAEQARRRQPRAVAGVGAPLRAPSSRPARPAAFASTRPPTSSACGSCNSTSPKGWPPPRRPRSRRAPWPAKKRPRPRSARRRCATSSPTRSTASTSRGRRRSSTGCSPWPPWRRCSAKSCCPTCASSESAGQRGDASVAQEHFASGVLRGRLLGLARGWGLGLGPAAVLACLPGEQHDLGLIAFGLALRARGWRIVYLGPDAPIETVEDVSRRLEPEPGRPHRGERRARAAGR